MNTQVHTTATLHGGNITSQFNPSTGEVLVILQIDTPGHYGLSMTIDSQPRYYSLSGFSRIEVISDAANVNISIDILYYVEWKFDVDYDVISGEEELFLVSLFNSIGIEEDVLVGDVNVEPGTVLNSENNIEY